MLLQGDNGVRPAAADGPVAPLPAAGGLAAPLPAAPDGPAGTRSRSERVPDAILMAGGLLCAAVGVAVMVSWFTRTTAIVRFGSPNPMVFNTALGLAVSGFALIALARRRPRAALAAGVFEVALGVLILAEYALGHGLGIDQLVVKAYISAPHNAPGRTPLNSAACLTLTGVGLLAWGPWCTRRRPAVLAAAASAIAAVAVAALFGYATGTTVAYGWMHVAAMAVLTALTFLILAFSLLSAAWRDYRAHHGGLPRWLPMPAGALALGLGLWLAIDGRAAATGRISVTTFTTAATVLGLVTAGLVALVAWLAQQAEGRRRVAVTAASRQAEAERAAREGEHRLFQFLNLMPVGVFIASPGGRPYYASDQGKRLLGLGVTPVGGDELAETYSVFQAGTGRRYATEDLPIVRALHGHPSHVEDVEIHHPGGSITPLEVWACPAYGTGGQVDYAIAAFADMSERNARDKTIAGQAALLDLAHDAIFVRQLDGHISYWNAGAESTYGFTRAEADRAHLPRLAPHAVSRAARRRRGHRGPVRPLGRRAYSSVCRRAVHHRGEPLGRAARTRGIPGGLHGNQP